MMSAMMMSAMLGQYFWSWDPAAKPNKENSTVSDPYPKNFEEAVLTACSLMVEVVSDHWQQIDSSLSDSKSPKRLDHGLKFEAKSGMAY